MTCDPGSLLADFESSAIAAADAARPITLKHFRTKLSVDSKDDRSPVTIADQSAELAMREVLALRHPMHGLLGEEFGSKEALSEHLWVLDPIDGTKSYITGSPLWGTLIAHILAEEAVLGLVDVPVLNERWLALRGAGTTCNGRAVHVSSCQEFRQARIQTTSPDAFTTTEWTIVDQITRDAALRRFSGDCYLFTQLAAGHIDAAIESGLQAYDYMALVCVVQEAGGLISDWRGQPLNLHSCGQVVASATPELHQQLLARLAEVAHP